MALNKKKKTSKGKSIRINISLQPVVAKWAEEVMLARGHPNISAFVADLIRRAQEKEEERRATGTFKSPQLPEIEQLKKSDAK